MDNELVKNNLEIRTSKKLVYLFLFISLSLLIILLAGYFYIIYSVNIPQASDIFSSAKIRIIGLFVISFISFIPYFKIAAKRYFNRLFITDTEVKITAFLSSQTIPAKQIADIHIDSTIMQKIIGIGNVSFETAGGKIFLFTDIDAGLEKKIIKALNL
ncbi:MAG: PH domain-containing protein [bacterium]